MPAPQPLKIELPVPEDARLEAREDPPRPPLTRTVEADGFGMRLLCDRWKYEAGETVCVTEVLINTGNRPARIRFPRAYRMQRRGSLKLRPKMIRVQSRESLGRTNWSFRDFIVNQGKGTSYLSLPSAYRFGKKHFFSLRPGEELKARVEWVAMNVGVYRFTSALGFEATRKIPAEWKNVSMPSNEIEITVVPSSRQRTWAALAGNLSFKLSLEKKPFRKGETVRVRGVLHNGNSCPIRISPRLSGFAGCTFETYACFWDKIDEPLHLLPDTPVCEEIGAGDTRVFQHFLKMESTPIGGVILGSQLCLITYFEGGWIEGRVDSLNRVSFRISEAD
jgi:hypothetical protein